MTPQMNKTPLTPSVLSRLQKEMLMALLRQKWLERQGGCGVGGVYLNKRPALNNDNGLLPPFKRSLRV